MAKSKRASAESNNDRTGIRLDLSPEAHSRLEAIRKHAGVATNKRAVSNAIRLYDWYLKKLAEGYSLAILRGDEMVEIELCFDDPPPSETSKPN
jgi:hypothetical protein